MKFLVTSFTGLGNIINKTPSLKAILGLFPKVEVHIVGDNRWGALDLMSTAYFINEIFDLSKHSKVETQNWLKENHYDAVFIAVDCAIPNWFNKMINESNCKMIFKHIRINQLNNMRLRDWYRLILNKPKKVYFIPMLHGKHDIDVNYDLLEACFNIVKPLPDGYKRSYDTWVPTYSDKKQATLKRFNIIPHEYFCFQVCAANGNPTPKIWDYKNFIALFEQLKKSRPHNDIVLIGDKGDFNNYIKKISWPDYVIQAASKTDLGEMVTLIKNALCVVAHDSGIMHIANALDVNLIALYGPTDFTWTKPMGKNTEILFSRNDAFACMYNEKSSEREAYNKYGDFYAMSGISVKDVLDSLQPFLYSG